MLYVKTVLNGVLSVFYDGLEYQEVLQMKYQIIVDYKKTVDCLNYADMMFRSMQYRFEGHHVQEVTTRLQF